MDRMIDAIAAVMNGRPADLLYVGRPRWETKLGAEYNVAQWYASADPDQRRLFLYITTKTELEEYLDESLRDRFFLSEFVVSGDHDSEHGMPARGLGLAYLLLGAAVSLPSEERWRMPRIRLHYAWIDEKGADQAKQVQVPNLSERGHAEAAADQLLQINRAHLTREPSNLAAMLGEVFPHLRFGRDVNRHVAKLPQSLLPVLISKLITLDDASRAWRRNADLLGPTLPKCHPESKPTMQKYGAHRVFRDPEGKKATYELHAMAGASHRIHMRVVHDPRGVEIGYIGNHLPTIKHN